MLHRFGHSVDFRIVDDRTDKIDNLIIIWGVNWLTRMQ